MANLKIADRYFSELKHDGHSVPRNEKTGDTLNLKVSKVYSVENVVTKEVLKAKCTQDCPSHLVLIDQ